MNSIRTPEQANSIYRRLYEADEGRRYGVGSLGFQPVPVETAIDDMLAEPGARLRNDLCGVGLNVVQRADGSIVGLRDDANEGAWAIVIEATDPPMVVVDVAAAATAAHDAWIRTLALYGKQPSGDNLAALWDAARRDRAALVAMLKA